MMRCHYSPFACTFAEIVLLKMKVVQKGDRIVLKKENDHREIEETIAELSRQFDRLRASCEDRHSDEFPVDTVRRIVGSGGKLCTLGKGVNVDTAYLEYVTERRDVCSYFKERLDAFDKDGAAFELKRSVLKAFADRLEKALSNAKA